MKQAHKLYNQLFQAVEELHTTGDSRQRKLADEISTLIAVHLDARGLKPEDIGDDGVEQ